MKRLFLLFLLVSGSVYGQKFSDFTAETSPAGTDHVVGYRTAGVTGGNRRFTLTTLNTYFSANLSLDWARITAGKPTTLAGYGITDALTAATASSTYQPLITPGSIGATQLASTAVTPGAYTLASITVDADGRITAAANGSSGSGDMLKSVYDTDNDGKIDPGAMPSTVTNLTVTGTLTIPAGGVSDAAIASTITRDSELAAAISGLSAGSLPVGARCDLVTGTTPPSTFLLADGSNGTPTLTADTGTTAYIQGNGTVATPTVDVAAGTYTSTQSVTPSCATSGASLYYTFGSSPADPTTSSTAVSGAISVSASGTLKVRAFKNLYSPSSVLSTAYTITAGSTPGFIAYTDFTGTDSATSGSIDTTGANCVAVFVSWWSGGTVGGSPLTDSKGNTYTAVSGGSAGNGTWYIATNATVGTGHTVTFATTGGYPFVRVIALSNIATASALDVQAQASGSGVSTQASGAMTTTVGNTMVLAGLVLGNSMSGISVDSSLTLAGSTSNAGGIAYGVKAAGSVNPAFTWTGTTNATTYAIALKSN